MRLRKGGACLALAVAVIAVGSAGAAGDPGFITEQESMLMLGDRADVEFKPIITVGETLPSGYRFEAIPDGISIYPRTRQKVDVYVNHETSTVAFPYVAAGPTVANSQNDFDNSQLSLLSLNPETGGVLNGQLVIKSSENFQRFCSNYLATKAEGFSRPTLFTNEESPDWVYRTGTAWTKPIPAGTAGAEQTGLVVAHDVKTGKHKPIYGMGRHNHENDVAIPGYNGVVVLSGDDTFTTTPASSQLYSYIAGGRDALWNDKGTLHAFFADDPAKNDYLDIQAGDAPVAGEFKAVPKMIATGKKADGTEIMSTDFPGMSPPPAGIPDGPQWVLDQWGNAANNTYGKDVFDFIRLEYIAYDKRPGMSKVVYIADTGRGTAGPANPLTTSTNGRIWKIELDPSDPRKAKLSILVQGDDSPVKTLGEIHQPDNLETTANGSLLVTEDPGSSQQFALPTADPNATTARLWRVPLAGGLPEVVAKVDQSTEGTPPDVGPPGLSNWGAWESSGIVDASEVFGPGVFLIDVQAHTLWVEKDEVSAPDAVAPAGPDWTFKREGGQLLLIKIPGA
ncbi:MAG: DUF839 domain-containing protein [Actinobacteria bacterium]|nr:DUF839 domain-containing protein [Actinomycetota bacterium]